jgi:hypothetical protein
MIINFLNIEITDRQMYPKTKQIPKKTLTTPTVSRSERIDYQNNKKDRTADLDLNRQNTNINLPSDD